MKNKNKFTKLLLSIIFGLAVFSLSVYCQGLALVTNETPNISPSEPGAKIASQAVTGQGNNSPAGGDDVDLLSGNFYFESLDLAIPFKDINLEFKRYYNSQLDLNSPLGYNWAHTYSKKLVFFDNDDNGYSDMIKVYYPDGSVSTFLLGE